VESTARNRESGVQQGLDSSGQVPAFSTKFRRKFIVIRVNRQAALRARDTGMCDIERLVACYLCFHGALSQSRITAFDFHNPATDFKLPESEG
jgi:hypothetical protein